MPKENHLFIIFTCEHASNAIPLEYQHLFVNKKKLLSTHCGYDLGTKEIGTILAKFFKAPIIYGKFSRLLIDLNRSAKHKSAFSDMTKDLPTQDKERIIETFHQPHWHEVRSLIDKKIQKGFHVLHIGVHSFTPILFGEIRNADIGLLYDPSRKQELKTAILWQNALKEHTQLRIRRNYPYLGKLDGLTTQLRKNYSEKNYSGIEVEVNHACLVHDKAFEDIGRVLAETLQEVH